MANNFLAEAINSDNVWHQTCKAFHFVPYAVCDPYTLHCMGPDSNFVHPEIKFNLVTYSGFRKYGLSKAFLHSVLLQSLSKTISIDLFSHNRIQWKQQKFATPDSGIIPTYEGWGPNTHWCMIAQYIIIYMLRHDDVFYMINNVLCHPTLPGIEHLCQCLSHLWCMNTLCCKVVRHHFMPVIWSSL